MMFSKLSIFIAATLAAFVAEAVPQTNSAKTLSCPSGPVKCCTKKRAATEDDIKLAHDKLNVGITAGTEIWADCFNFDKTCAGFTVCCTPASDGSIAIGCTDAKA